MSQANSFVVMLFLAFTVGIYCTPICVNEVPIRIIQSPCTEEMWVYLIKPIPNDAVYIFYQKEVFHVKLIPTNAILTLTQNSATPNTVTESLEAVIAFNRWIHVVMTKNIMNNGLKIQAQLYVNEKKSSGNLEYTLADLVTLGLTIERGKSKVFGSFSGDTKSRVVELHLSPKL